MLPLVIIVFGLSIVYYYDLQSQPIVKNDILSKFRPVESSEVTLMAVGDIMLSRHVEEKMFGANDYALPFSQIWKLLSGANLTFGNLESPFYNQGPRMIKGMIFKAEPEAITGLKLAGFDILSLANNHVMDYGCDGLNSTICALKNAGVMYVGAGSNLKEARAPLFININGIRIACLARTAVFVSSASYAEKYKPGVASLDIEEIEENINMCQQQADIVLLLLHWGIEEYHYPSPKQKALSKDFLTAGADLILGHHPHVLQGVKVINNKFVSYSSGNFLFDDFTWSYKDKNGLLHDNIEKLSNDNRKAGVLRLMLSENGFDSYKFLPTFIHSDGVVREDMRGERMNEFALFTSRIQLTCYRLFWRVYSIRREWILRVRPMMNGNIKWNNIKKVRPYHIKYFLDRLRRSAKITTEKSSNPYD